ncbi:hypothetical protein AMECASPLE_021876 [Ameca splendens]|uniref:Uncharacterized protein n=1 Tax=Ameca splendens TaxID=208324 RepID=A0ABV0ZNG9_9TELE
MSFCQQRDISALFLSGQSLSGVPGGRGRTIGKGGAFMQPVASWDVHMYSLLGCAGSCPEEGANRADPSRAGRGQDRGTMWTPELGLSSSNIKKNVESI